MFNTPFIAVKTSSRGWSRYFYNLLPIKISEHPRPANLISSSTSTLDIVIYLRIHTMYFSGWSVTIVAPACRYRDGEPNSGEANSDS